MLKLDRSRDFGKITPAWQPDDCDRPAFYEQDNRLYDAHDRLIEPGKPLPVQVVPEVTSEGDRAKGPAMSPAELIRQADTLPWPQFHKGAKAILGKLCPPGKPAIVLALQEALTAYEARVAKRSSGAAKGMTWDGMVGGPGEPPTAEPAPGPVAKANGGVDLAAWGRGQKDYLFGEVQKAIRTTLHRQVTERRDAVDFLIEAGVIQAAEARRDVMSDPVRMAPTRDPD